MHYVTLVAVDIPEVQDEPEVDEAIKSAMDELRKKEYKDDGNHSFIRDIHLMRLQARMNAFSRAVEDAVSEAMGPYDENTDDPRFLEFDDMTEETEKEYRTESTQMVRLPDGKYVFPYSRAFSEKFVVREGKVFQRNAGPCKHETRTKKAKKMQVVSRPFRKIYSSFKIFAEEHHGYVYRNVEDRCGYYSNPRSFWDWYVIGGRWPYELLVKEDCKEYFLSECDAETLPPTPEGYIWVSAARKKDIAWDVMRDWNEQEARLAFATLEKAFADGKLPKGFFGQMKEDGISGWGGMIYVKGESVEDYLKRRCPEISEKYCIHPYGFLDCNGWNTHETFVYDRSNPRFEEKDGWRRQLHDFIENADDHTVLVIVDNHN